MRVYLDEKPLAVPGDSLATAIRAAGDEAERAGRVVIEVKLDGRLLDDAALDAAPTVNVATASEVRFTSTDPGALAHSSLMDAADLLEGVRPEQRAAAAAMAAGDFETAMAGLGRSIEVWDTVRRVVDGTAALLRWNLAEVMVPDATPGGAPVAAAALIDRLAALLDRVRAALSGQDWSALGDALEFDLDGEAETWGQALRGLARRARPSA